MNGYSDPNSQALFYQQYEMVRRDEVVGILLALFLGTFGAHHFYLGRTGLGILYVCFFWTGIPAIAGLIECFLMPARVREFNAFHAAAIAAALGIPVPVYGQPIPVVTTIAIAPTVVAAVPADMPCPRCQHVNPAIAHFCAGCGQAL